MRCSKCGMPMDEDTDSCPGCGASVRTRDRAKAQSDDIQVLSHRPELEDDPVIPASGQAAQPKPIPTPGQDDSAAMKRAPRAAGLDLDHDVPPELLAPEDPSPMAQAAAKIKGNIMLIAGLALALVFINRYTRVFDDLLGRSKTASAEAPAAPVAPPPMPAPTRPAQGAEPQPNEPVSEPAPKPAPVEPLVVDWRFEGMVYDMVTLRPIKGAQLVFMGGDQDYTFSTDREGHYKAKVPPLDGASYQVLVDQAEYLEGYFDDGDPPYRNRSRAARMGMRNAKPKNKLWEGGAEISRRDLVLFPEVSY